MGSTQQEHATCRSRTKREAISICCVDKPQSSACLGHSIPAGGSCRGVHTQSQTQDALQSVQSKNHTPWYCAILHRTLHSCSSHRTVAECVIAFSKYNCLKILFKTDYCWYIPVWHILTITIPSPLFVAEVLFVRHEKETKPNDMKRYFVNRSVFTSVSCGQ